MASSIGKIPQVAPYSGDMLAMVARCSTGRLPIPGPVNSTNFPTTPWLPQDLGDGQHEVGRGRSARQLAGQPEANHRRHEHGDRLAEHGGLRLYPADSPAEHSEAVHHRRVRVGADDRVGERPTVLGLEDDPRQVLEVHLVADTRSRAGPPVTPSKACWAHLRSW